LIRDKDDVISSEEQNSFDPPPKRNKIGTEKSVPILFKSILTSLQLVYHINE